MTEGFQQAARARERLPVWTLNVRTMCRVCYEEGRMKPGGLNLNFSMAFVKDSIVYCAEHAPEDSRELKLKR